MHPTSFAVPTTKVDGGSSALVRVLDLPFVITKITHWIGAHLPGFDASPWNTSCTPYQGRLTPGVTVYRTSFSLNIPHDADIPLAFDLELDNTQPHRVLIYVNGWQFGRYVSRECEQKLP